MTQERRSCVRQTLRTRKGTWYATSLLRQLQKKMRQTQKLIQIIVHCITDKMRLHRIFLETMVIIKIHAILIIGGFEKCHFPNPPIFLFSFWKIHKIQNMQIWKKNWYEGHGCGSSYMVIRLFWKGSFCAKNNKICIFSTISHFLLHPH